MTLTELTEIKQNYKVLELAVDFINPSYNISRAKHLDTARYIICTLTENGIPRGVKTNETARIRLQKPDRTYVYNDCDILEDGRVFITLTEQILAVEGNAVCDIQLTDEETGIIYSTKNFIINIDKTAVNNSIMESTNEFGALNNLIANNKKLNEELNSNEEIRQTNEAQRSNNENERQSNETNRQIAEDERINAENTRKSNENQRIGNENTRQTNETARQTQETDRETNTAAAISNAEKATKKANDAADGLQNKLDSHHFVLSEDKGIANGVAELDSNGLIPSNQLPSYVDDVIEGYLHNNKFYKDAEHTTEITRETGKIYVDLSSNKTYRWSGSGFAVISETIALGETSSTAYRGDRGKIAYDHSQTVHAPVNAEENQNTFSNVTVGSTTISANSKTDTLTFAAGDNITLTPDTESNKITISSTGGSNDSSHTHNYAGSDTPGGIAINADKLDGYHADMNITGHTIPIRDSGGNIYAKGFYDNGSRDNYKDDVDTIAYQTITNTRPSRAIMTIPTSSDPTLDWRCKIGFNTFKDISARIPILVYNTSNPGKIIQFASIKSRIGATGNYTNNIDLKLITSERGLGISNVTLHLGGEFNITGFDYYNNVGGKIDIYAARVEDSSGVPEVRLYYYLDEGYESFEILDAYIPQYLSTKGNINFKVTAILNSTSELPSGYVTGKFKMLATVVEGYSPSVNAVKNTLALRDDNGFLNAVYFSQSSARNENPSNISQIIVTNNSDNYFRKASLSHVKTALGNMPPTSHTSTNKDTYGAATNSVYGHVELFDSYSPPSSGHMASAGYGYAPSLYALESAYSILNGKLSKKMQLGSSGTFTSGSKTLSVVPGDIIIVTGYGSGGGTWILNIYSLTSFILSGSYNSSGTMSSYKPADAIGIIFSISNGVVTLNKGIPWSSGYYIHLHIG